MHPPPGHVCFVGRVGLQTGQSADRDGDNSASAASSKIRNRMHPSSGRGRFVGLVCFRTSQTADRDGGSSFSASPPGMASSIFINRMHRGPRVACVSSAVCAFVPVGLLTATAAAAFRLRLHGVVDYYKSNAPVPVTRGLRRPCAPSHRSVCGPRRRQQRIGFVSGYGVVDYYKSKAPVLGTRVFRRPCVLSHRSDS